MNTLKMSREESRCLRAGMSAEFAKACAKFVEREQMTAQRKRIAPPRWRCRFINR